jgi:hypothetical protein
MNAMEAAELLDAPVEAASVEVLVKAADAGGVFRRCVATLDELYDIIAPATPDRLTMLDEAGSIFRADWWTGNDDALAQACADVGSLLACADVIPLSGITASPEAAGHAGFSFCLVLPPDLINEA